jgi:hypothetical protein
MPDTNFTITLGGTAYSWASGALNTANGMYKGNITVTNLTWNASGQPVTFTVGINHGNPSIYYTFAFSNGPTNGTVSITWPSPTAGTDSDTWSAAASMP